LIADFDIVIAADVTLGQLSNTLRQNTITPNTKIVVFEKNGVVMGLLKSKRLMRLASPAK
jgi:hypothetical protein